MDIHNVNPSKPIQPAATAFFPQKLDRDPQCENKATNYSNNRQSLYDGFIQLNFPRDVNQLLSQGQMNLYINIEKPELACFHIHASSRTGFTITIRAQMWATRLPSYITKLICSMLSTDQGM